MTEQQKEIQANNILLAVFMGLTLQECGGYLCSDSQEVIEVENLTYDSDWQMLMQVVDKIESINYGAYDVSIYRGGVQIIKLKSLETIAISENGRTKIENVYNACVDFVKWYNNLNKKTHE